MSTPTETPDAHSSGLTGQVDALRYDGHSDDPFEVAGVLRSLMPEHARVLDVGCGTGSVTEIVNRGKSNRVCAVEPDLHRAERARSRGFEVHCEFLTAEFLREHGPFDVVMFADVLEHLPDPAKMLRLARSGLAASGILLASVPNVAHWSIRLDLLRGRFNYTESGLRDATHLRWFTRGTLEALLHTQGFEVLEFRHTAGTTLPEYHTRRPWKWLSPSRRLATVRQLTAKWPLVFACQHVVKARVRALSNGQ